MAEPLAAAAPPLAALQADGVGHSYGGRRALDDLSFVVRRGEVFGFLGPNGGGKTTLFRMLATLLPLREGRVKALGFDLATEARALRRRLGVVFQSPSLDLRLTVRENLVYHGHLYGLRGETLARRVEAGLARFGLAGRARDFAAVLSGGLRRRLEIAKALLHDPELLLLDEPSTGLDPSARRQLWSLLEELRGEGVTVLLTTHFLEEGDRCGRVALLDGGRLIAEGSPAELKAEVGGDVVVVRCREPEALREHLRRRFEVEAEAVEDGLRFEHPAGHELVPRLLESFRGEVRSVTVSEPTLEDVLRERTGHGLGDGEEVQP